jgi:hypothetical protein
LVQIRVSPDAGKHDNLRRVVDAGSQENLLPHNRLDLPILLIANPFGALAGKNQRNRRGIGNDRQVRPIARAVEISHHRRLAFAVSDVVGR